MQKEKQPKPMQDESSTKSKSEESKNNHNQQENSNPSQNQSSPPPKTVTMTEDEWNGVKLQLASAVNSYKELERDFENFRARSRENINSARDEGISKAVLTIASVLDTFKKAKTMVEDERAKNGMELVEKSILSSLEKLGVKPIKAVGEMFDATYHNAVVLQEIKGATSGSVVEEMEMGFTLNGKVIKYSQVVVAK